MSTHRVSARALALGIAFGVLATATPANAQSIATGLFRLLTDQTPPPAGYVRDSVAAETTFRTVAGLFKVDLTSLPVASSSGGFVYRFEGVETMRWLPAETGAKTTFLVTGA